MDENKTRLASDMCDPIAALRDDGEGEWCWAVKRSSSEVVISAVEPHGKIENRDKKSRSLWEGVQLERSLGGQ